jgi:hypothetical protein
VAAEEKSFSRARRRIFLPWKYLLDSADLIG